MCLCALLQLPVRRRNTNQEVQFKGSSDGKMLHNSLYPLKRDFTAVENYYRSDDLLLCLDACHINSKISKATQCKAFYVVCMCLHQLDWLGLDTKRFWLLPCIVATVELESTVLSDCAAFFFASSSQQK